MAVNHHSYPQYFFLRDERPRWMVFAAALALTALLVVLIRLGLVVSVPDEIATPPSSHLLVMPIEPAPPPEPREPSAAPFSPSAPPPAPAAPAFMPPTQIVLSPQLVPSSESAPVAPANAVGSGTVPTAGSGTGEGSGTSVGNGGGGGGVALPPANLRVSWAPSMRMRWLSDYIPEAARASGTRGLAVLNCEVLRDDRVRDCSVMSESPRGQGFGEAALAAQHVYRVRVHDTDGNRLYNRRFRLRAIFYPGE